uniref:Uncharacterized protein n=1 Tax=Cannabis sativa TaxID=3483 RepID=A0A803PQQ3_CANSA
MEKMMARMQANFSDIDKDSEEDASEEPIYKEKRANPTDVGTLAPTKDKGKAKVGEPQTKTVLLPPKINMNITNQPLRTKKAANAYRLECLSALRGPIVHNNMLGT